MIKRLIPFIFLLTILGIISLPGPNGLIAFIKRKMENRRLTAEIRDLRIKNILLRAKKKNLTSPKYYEAMIEEKRGMRRK